MTRRTLLSVLAFAAVIVGLGLRLPTVVAGSPYLNYVDEGHVLHPVSRMVESGAWDPGSYLYPSLPLLAIATASRLGRIGLAEPVGEQSRPGPYYDLVAPFELILLGRIMVVALATAISLQIAATARRLAGARAGLVALWVAALLPALVARSAIVTVDIFATLLVLLALDAADRARRGTAPGVAVVLAGAALGLAVTSKYTAAVVAGGVALSLMLADWPWRQRLGALVATGGVSWLVAILVMPALLFRPGAVWSAIKTQADVYRQIDHGSYLDQAFRRAEWDLPMPGAELGFFFVSLALAGLVLCLCQGRWRPTVLPWLVYAVPLVLTLSSYSLRPFRNLLPLAGLGCVSIGVLAGWLGERIRRAWLVDVVAVVLPIVLFAPQLSDYVADQLRLDDSRVQAVDWLRQRVAPGERVLVLAPLAILPSELSRIGAGTLVRQWPGAARSLRREQPRFVVVGELRAGEGTSLDEWQRRLAGYELRLQLGEEPTPPEPSWWRGNRQILYIFERDTHRRGG